MTQSLPINVNSDNWFLQDKFVFSAQNTTNNDNLSYYWEIADLQKDKVIFKKNWNLFTYSFREKGRYNVRMKVTEPSWESNIDSKIIYINSRAPYALFESSIPFKNKPNKIFLDATKSFDPDFQDEWKLKYSWIIDWKKVKLKDTNFNNSTGYYTFNSIWDHSVILDVEDSDNISSQLKSKVTVDSILSVDFDISPRVANRKQNVILILIPQKQLFIVGIFEIEILINEQIEK